MRKIIFIVILVVLATTKSEAKQYIYDIGTHRYDVTTGVQSTTNGLTSCIPWKWICSIHITDIPGSIKTAFTYNENVLFISFENNSIKDETFKEYLSGEEFEFDSKGLMPYFEFSKEMVKELGLPKDFKIYPGKYAIDKSKDGFTTIVIE